LADQNHSSYSDDLLTENLSKRVTFRLTPTEYEAFKAVAHHAGDSQGETVRMLIKALTTGRYHPPGDCIDELTKLSANFSRVGNNLNQIARRLNQRKGVPSEDLVETIALIQIQTVQIKRALRDMVCVFRDQTPPKKPTRHG